MYMFYKQKFARTRNPELVTEISIMHSKDTLNKPVFIEVSAFQHLQLINNSGQFFFFLHIQCFWPFTVITNVQNTSVKIERKRACLLCFHLVRL